MVCAVPTHSKLFKLPAVAKPLDVREVAEIVEQMREFDPALKIRAVKKLQALSLDDFRAQMADLNNPRVRLLCNFLRAPLFFNAPGSKTPALKRMFGGHWSPLGAYLPDKVSQAAASLAHG